MRIRSVKPEFLLHFGIYQAEAETGLPLRVSFMGLWMAADREGRFKWRPEALKAQILPHDPINFSSVLDALADRGFIVQYSDGDDDLGAVVNFTKHQVVNSRETQSKLAPPPDLTPSGGTQKRVEPHVHAPAGINIPNPLRETILARDGKCLRCRTLEDLTVDHIFPRSIGGTHAVQNLRTLCRACNSARPVAGQGLIDDLAKDGLSLDDMKRICAHVHAREEGNKEGKGREQGREGNQSDASIDFIKIGDQCLDILGIDPAKWTGNFQIVQMWLNEGANPERHVFPAIKAVADRFSKTGKPPPGSLAYFTNAIRDLMAGPIASPDKSKNGNGAGTKISDVDQAWRDHFREWKAAGSEGEIPDYDQFVIAFRSKPKTGAGSSKKGATI